MPKLLEVENADGTSTLVAVLEPGDDVQAVSRLGDAGVKLAGKAEQTMSSILRSAVGMASSVHEALDGSPVKTATLEVGVQLTATGNVYVVGGQAQAAIKLTLTMAGPAGTD